jgi:hypothetical protein
MTHWGLTDTYTRTFTANEAIAKHALVTLLSTGNVENTDAQTEEPIGHAMRDAAANEEVAVRLMVAPSQNAISAGAITVGNKVYPTATAGKVDDAGTPGTHPVLGVCVEAASAADEIIVYIPICETT